MILFVIVLTYQIKNIKNYSLLFAIVLTHQIKNIKITGLYIINTPSDTTTATNMDQQNFYAPPTGARPCAPGCPCTVPWWSEHGWCGCETTCAPLVAAPAAASTTTTVATSAPTS